jgi:hypothetical protein
MLRSWTHRNSALVVLLAVAFTRCVVADAETALDAPTEPLDEFLAVAQRLEDEDALFVGGSREETLRQRLQGVPAGDGRIVESHVLLGRELLRLGDPAAALRQMRQALAQEGALWQAGTAPGFGAADSKRSVERRKKLLFQLVLAAIRLGEQVNCIDNHGPASCILPIRGSGVHSDGTGARAAMQYALDYLRLAPDDLKGVWFLNLAAMQAGRYPDGVPRDWRIEPDRFAAPSTVGGFRDIAVGLGVSTFDLAGGSVVDDIDNDGYFDIVTSSMDPRKSLTYLHNEADGSFADRTLGSGLEGQLGGLNLIHTDYDDDGRVDLFVLRGGWLQALGGIRNSLLHNTGDGTFVDVTYAAGLAEPAHPTQTGAWADFDGDGDLDLFVGNEGEQQGSHMELFADNLFRNEADGSFVDVALEAGVTNNRYAKGSAWGDFDADGDADLYVSNVGPNRLYQNDGSGRFADVAPRLGVTEPAKRSFATWFFDYDNDGDLDLFVVSYLAKVEDIAADVLGRETAAQLWPRLYRNDGGTFAEVTAAAGLDHPSLPMGANFGDIDEDGFLDIYLGTGSPSFESQMPNLMYRNQGDGTFADVTYAAGFGHLQKGHGISFADFDRDGDDDVALQTGGFYPGDRFRNALFDNPGHGHHWLGLKLVGTESNRAAVGTRIHLRVATDEGERSIFRWVGTGGSFGGSPLEQFIGLGQALRIVIVEVEWPASGRRQRFTDVPMDTTVRIVEGEASLQIVAHTPLTWALKHGSATHEGMH